MNMNKLVYAKHEEAVCSSRDIAFNFNKRHDNVVRAIENIIEGMSKIEEPPLLFRRSFYIDEQNGQRYPMYLMNRDGFALLVMGFTGEKALEWKLQYINAFNAMEKLLKEQSTEVYIESRKYGKLTRRSETDAIHKLVEYAKAQGSEHSEKLYLIYSRLANSAVGIEDRELATIEQINELTFIENIISNQIMLGMQIGKPYKEIYQDCKQQIELFRSVAYLNTRKEAPK